MTSSKPFEINALDPLTAGIFHAPTSGERSARLREWLQTEPSEDFMSEVYRELSGRDKGVAKLLKEKLDELKRLHGQEALATEWAQKAENLLQAPRLNIADALAWQRDAAKAGAPLSREPLANLKQRLTEVVKGVEDLQHQVMVQREAAVLLAQRIEVLSTKSLAEALGGQAGLQADVAQWQSQAMALTQNSVWPSVDLKYPPQLEGAGLQLQAVWEGFSAAASLASLAQSDTSALLPPVPVWAEEIRRLLHQFAAGFLKQPEPALVQALAQRLIRPASPHLGREWSALLAGLGGALRHWTARPDNLSARAEVLRIVALVQALARQLGNQALLMAAHQMTEHAQVLVLGDLAPGLAAQLQADAQRLQVAGSAFFTTA